MKSVWQHSLKWEKNVPGLLVCARLQCRLETLYPGIPLWMKLSQLSYWCNWQLVSGLEAVMALTTRQGDSRIFKQDVPAPYAACSHSSNPGVPGVKLASPAASYPWRYPSDFFYRSISQINRLVQAISFPEGQVMSPARVELTTANKTDWDDLLRAPVSQLGLFFNSSVFQETWEDFVAVVQPFFPPLGARPGEADISVSKEELGSWSD